MLNELNPTTRTFPRTVGEAFPDSLERTGWIHPPERERNLASIVVGGAGVLIWIVNIILIIHR